MNAAGPIAEFLAHLEVERRVSAHTLDAYRRDLAALAEWAQGQGIGDTAALDAARLRAFVAAEHRRGLSPKSLQRRLSACRSYFQWLLKHGRIALNPASAIRAPKAPRKLPQVLDADEATRLVEVPTDAPFGLRDRALLELFYSSGLRLSELCALRWRDLDLGNGLVTVLGKGNKQRSVPVGSHARAALEAWHGETKAPNEAPVFPGRGGAPISQRAVQLLDLDVLVDVEGLVLDPGRAHRIGDRALAEAAVLEQLVLHALAQRLGRDGGRQQPHADDHHQVDVVVHAQPGGVDPGHAAAGNGGHGRPSLGVVL